MGGSNAFPKRFAMGLAVLGLLPALVIAIFLGFEEGHLVALGQPFGEFNLSRLTAALLSTLKPVYLLLPVALVAAADRRGFRFWSFSFGASWLLVGPGFLAGVLVGGSPAGPSMAALLALSVLTCCLVLWLACLQRLTGLKLAVLFYGACWAASEFTDYLARYLAPHFESPVLSAAARLGWVLPQIAPGLTAIDEYLQAGQAGIQSFLPTLLQMPVLAAFLWWRGAAGNQHPRPDVF